MTFPYDQRRLIVVTGPTATGKTAFAAHLASQVGGEIISADSRQVYRGMNLATGKDFSDYIVGNDHIPYHLIDVAEPGDEYNVFEFQHDFKKVYVDIAKRGKIPVLCGGTGLYIESVLKGYQMPRVPFNNALRKELDAKGNEALIDRLRDFKTLHNVTDTNDRSRLIRALEIQLYLQQHADQDEIFPEFNPVIFGIFFDRETIRARITQRLKTRLDSGMADEVRELFSKGLSADQLKFYGLEYRYLTQYVTGELNYDDMFRLLNTAIHQFAKRQMTWFRKMEREGTNIHWIDGELDRPEQLKIAVSVLESND
jgi:tRNA dimethylallyltransferase